MKSIRITDKYLGYVSTNEKNEDCKKQEALMKSKSLSMLTQGVVGVYLAIQLLY